MSSKTRVFSSTGGSGNGHPQRRLNGRPRNAESIEDPPESCANSGTSPDSPSIKITLDGREDRLLTADQIGNEDEAAEVLEACASASDVSVDITELLQFNDELVAVFDLLVKLPDASFRSTAQDEDVDLVTAVIELIPSDADLEQYTRGKRAALYCAAITYPDALEGACNRIVAQMRSHGTKGVCVKELVREARSVLADLEARPGRGAEDDLQITVLEILPDAPVSKDAVVPPGWVLGEEGVRSCEDKLFCIPAPIVIAGRGKDVATGSELWRLAWYRDGAWHERLVDRVEASTSRTIVGLAEYGVPVTSNNASVLINFLSEFETANLSSMPVARVSRRLGFHQDNRRCDFLWGRNIITAKKIIVASHDGGSSGRDLGGAIMFHGADEGDEQLADAFQSAGSFEEWKDAIQPLADHPKAKLALYASLVPPLLHVLKSPNFCLDFSGETTTGKTTALRIAASCWGYPFEDSNDKASAIRTWNATGVFTERLQTTLNHLPVILDDTKHARHPDQVASTIYAVSQGKGRGRGTVKGTARQDAFQTVLISSGEQPATSFTEDGGVRARVLTLWGSPFGETDQAMGQAIRELNRQIRNNYGHAGPRFVRRLLVHRKTWSKFVRFYEDRIRIYERWAGQNPLALRMTTHFGATFVAMTIAHVALDLPWEPEDCVEILWDDLVGEIGDRITAALRHVVDWAHAHPDQFWAVRESRIDQPHGGWVGRWDRMRSVEDNGSSESSWDWIGFFPQQLDKILQEGGFEPKSTIRSWSDRGWLLCAADRRQHRTRINGELCRVVAITSAAVEEAENE